MAEPALDEQRLRRLIDAGRGLLIAPLDVEPVLRQLLDVAREVTGARYAAVGVLDEPRRALERFITAGVDDATHRRIGDLPRGRGILGLLIEEPRPLRLEHLGEHPRACGFPAAHPEMETFLGVPVVIRDEVWGNLYLTEKDGGRAFTAADEESVIILADWAAIAIDNARLYTVVERRRDDLERTVRALDTAVAIAQALGGETDLHRILELIVKRARALVGARTLVIVLEQDEELVFAAGAGAVPPGAEATRMPIEGTVTGQVLRSQRSERLTDARTALHVSQELLGLEADTALLVPLAFRGRAVGVLVAFDHLGGQAGFDREDERLLGAFAASAATAVATAQNASEEALKRAIEASEAERTRWARELHDATLQQLAGLRMLLSGARRSGDATRMAGAIDGALEQITTAIGDLRSLITELRPAALDELGTKPALESLVARFEGQTDIAVDLDVTDTRFTPEVESTVYRLVQEALTNIAKHARAHRVAVEITAEDGEIALVVRDDGTGFNPQQQSSGFGLIGMRERLALVNGTIEIQSSRGAGTELHARIPTG